MQNRVSVLCLALAALGFTAGAHGQILFSESFNVDPTNNWTYNSSMGDLANDNFGGEADFFFDYGSVGIPSAPNSVGGTTRGVKMEANVPGTATFMGMSVSPNGRSFTGDYILRFDAWQNFNGPFPGGGNGSTQMTHGGIGASGTNSQFPGGSLQGVVFAASGDGGTATDYRAYASPLVPAGAPQAENSGVYAAGAATGSTNNTNAYYSNNGFGNRAAPAAQLVLFPQQSGSTAGGTQGMAWHAWEISKIGNAITWEIDNVLIATLDASTVTFGGDNIAFGQFDINTTSSTDANARNLLFGLVDNVVVAVPEPSSAGAMIAGLGLLHLRRRRNCS